jgi:hypothetical protein
MRYVLPYYTAIYTTVLGLLGAVLTVNVIVNRDGGVNVDRAKIAKKRKCILRELGR